MKGVSAVVSLFTLGAGFHCDERRKAAPSETLKTGEKILEVDVISTGVSYGTSETQYWTRSRINNTMERLNREIKRRTKAIGAFPDGQSALMLVCARLRHAAGTQWGARRCMNMDHLSHYSVILTNVIPVLLILFR